MSEARTPDAHVVLVTPDGRELRIPAYYGTDGSLVSDPMPEPGVLAYVEPRFQIKAGTLVSVAAERHGEEKT